MTSTPRKPKRMLTAEQKYDLWLRMLTGQISQADAAAEAGVDRSVITPAASSCPRWSDRGAAGVEAGPAASVSPGGVGGRGVAGRGRPAPGDGGRAGRRVGGAAGKIALGMSGPVPARVDGTAKAALLSLIDDAVDAGWTLNRACAVVELDRGRAWRWQQRRAGGGLDDARPGGNPIHGLLEWEEAEILALFDEWGDVDRSHRKLAHRGCCEQRVWASPSTVDRVLARHGLALQGAPRPARTVKTPWPHWCEWHPNQLWCWDGSQFERCVAAKHAYAIVDLVSRKWISTHLTANPDSVAARVLFSRGLDNEGLLTDELRARLTDPDTGLPDGDQAPLLLAVSDNGTEMHANETRRFMALCSIAQHFGRPSTPTDQAWIESLWGHVKREHPHLTTITDPAVLAAELERVRVHHNKPPAARSDRLRHPQRRTRRPRRHHPRSPHRRHAKRRRTTPSLAPEPAMNPPTTLTNHNPPATIGCGLNPNPIRREESDTPHCQPPLGRCSAASSTLSGHSKWPCAEGAECSNTSEF